MNLDGRPAFQKLPLWRDANHCLLLIEQAVRDFLRSAIRGVVGLYRQRPRSEIKCPNVDCKRPAAPPIA